MEITHDTFGLLGSYVFVAVVLYALYKSITWGEESKKREKEFTTAAKVDVLDEQGKTITIVRTNDQSEVHNS